MHQVAFSWRVHFMNAINNLIVFMLINDLKSNNFTKYTILLRWKRSRLFKSHKEKMVSLVVISSSSSFKFQTFPNVYCGKALK